MKPKRQEFWFSLLSKRHKTKIVIRKTEGINTKRFDNVKQI